MRLTPRAAEYTEIEAKSRGLQHLSDIQLQRLFTMNTQKEKDAYLAILQSVGIKVRKNKRPTFYRSIRDGKIIVSVKRGTSSEPRGCLKWFAF